MTCTTRVLVALVLACGALSACRESTEPERAAALLREVQTANYRSWARAPGFETRQASLAAHDDAVEIFVNAVVSDALAGGPIESWPADSIIVKEGYSGDALGLIAIMEKTTSDQWFWAEYADDGEVLFSGSPTICRGCHQVGDDFVRAFFFPR